MPAALLAPQSGARPEPVHHHGLSISGTLPAAADILASTFRTRTVTVRNRVFPYSAPCKSLLLSGSAMRHRAQTLLCTQGPYGAVDSDERLRLAYVRGAPPAQESSMSPSPAAAPFAAVWNQHAAFSAAASPGPSSEEGEDNATEVYRLSIVRLADAEHAELAYLNASLSSNRSMVVCGAAARAAGMAPHAGSAANVSRAVCTPGAPMWLNVTHDVDWVRLQSTTCRAGQTSRLAV